MNEEKKVAHPLAWEKGQFPYLDTQGCQMKYTYFTYFYFILRHRSRV